MGMTQTGTRSHWRFLFIPTCALDSTYIVDPGWTVAEGCTGVQTMAPEPNSFSSIELRKRVFLQLGRRRIGRLPCSIGTVRLGLTFFAHDKDVAVEVITPSSHFHRLPPVPLYAHTEAAGLRGSEALRARRFAGGDTGEWGDAGELASGLVTLADGACAE
jgi:hypothetical protein